MTERAERAEYRLSETKEHYDYLVERNMHLEYYNSLAITIQRTLQFQTNHFVAQVNHWKLIASGKEDDFVREFADLHLARYAFGLIFPSCNPWICEPCNSTRFWSGSVSEYSCGYPKSVLLTLELNRDAAVKKANGLQAELKAARKEIRQTEEGTKKVYDLYLLLEKWLKSAKRAANEAVKAKDEEQEKYARAAQKLKDVLSDLEETRELQKSLEEDADERDKEMKELKSRERKLEKEVEEVRSAKVEQQKELDALRCRITAMGSRSGPPLKSHFT